MAHVLAAKYCRSALLLLAFLLPLPAMAVESATECPASGSNVQLQLTIENVRSARGSVTVSVYGDQPEDFLAKGKKLMKVRFPAKQGTVKGCITLPKAGTYALSLYHDEDGSGKFSTNMIGLPTEGFGFSNNPEVLVGPPGFDAAAFATQGAITALTIRLKYL
jgi:uncharacterized protein (DUF2141 family)